MISNFFTGLGACWLLLKQHTLLSMAGVVALCYLAFPKLMPARKGAAIVHHQTQMEFLLEELDDIVNIRQQRVLAATNRSWYEDLPGKVFAEAPQLQKGEKKRLLINRVVKAPDPRFFSLTDNQFLHPMPKVRLMPLLSTNGQKIVSNIWVARPKERLVVVDLDSGTESYYPRGAFVGSHLGKGNYVTVAMFAPDGSIVTGSRGTIDVWDAESGNLQRTLAIGDSSFDVKKGDISPEGDRIVVVDFRHSEAKVLKLDTGEEVFSFRPENLTFTYLDWAVFGPTGDTIAIPEWHGIGVWDTSTGQKVSQLDFVADLHMKDGQDIAAFTRSPDNRYLIGFRGGSTVMIDLESGGVADEPAFENFTRIVSPGRGAWSPDGRWIVLVTWLGKAFIWDYYARRTLPVTLDIPGPVDDIKWTPDGSKIVALSYRDVYVFEASEVFERD